MKKTNYIVAQANEPLDEAGHFVNKKVTARYLDGFREVESSRCRLYGRFAENGGFGSNRHDSVP